jgi:hypothetical protein
MEGSQQLFAQLVTNTNTSLTYSTIQAAIDDPLTINGHTLTLNPGIYVENIQVNKQLTINGPKIGVDGNDISRGTGEAIIYPASTQLGDITYNGGRIFNITADNVTIDGITLDGDNPLLTSGFTANGADFNADFGIVTMVSPWLITPDPAGNNLIIRNNILKNLKITAITMWSGYNETIAKAGQIKNNKIQNTPDGPAIYLSQNYYAAIENNTISDAHVGINVYFYWLDKPNSATGTIRNNTITLKTSEINNGIYSAVVQGIQIVLVYNGIVNSWTAENNVLTNTTLRSTGSRGIDFDVDWVPASLTVNNNNITGFESGYALRDCGNPNVPAESLNISGGTVNNCTYGINATNQSDLYVNLALSAIYNINQMTVLNSTTASLFIDDVSMNVSSVAVIASNCKFSNSPTGVLLSGNFAYDTLHENDLSGNTTFAINNTSPNNVIATCNWYGNASGPTNPANPGGTGGVVSSNVTFLPWLNNGTDNEPITPGFQPVPGSCVTCSINCPSNITRNVIPFLCLSIVNTPNPVFNGNCNVNKLTWVMTGATTGLSPSSGINYVGLRTFNTGVTTITYTASGAFGYTASCSFTVTIVDNFNPIILCPSNITQTATGNNCSRSINVPNPITFDNCSVAKLAWVMTGATTSSSPSTGINYVGTKIFNVGLTTITYTVADAANNATTCSFTVRVNGSSNCNSPQGSVVNNQKNSTQEITDQLLVKISPNPSNSYFDLKMISGSNEKLEINIYDVNGRMLKKINTEPYQSFHFGDNLMPGMYMIEVRQGVNREIIKVVKQ